MKRLTMVLAVATLWAATAWAASSNAGKADFMTEGLPPLPAAGPAICKGQFLTPQQGKAMLDYRLTKCTTLQAWQDYAKQVQKHILAGADLEPLPQRCPLKTIINGKRAHDGYTVENVAFQSVPGYYVTGCLYRPAAGNGPFPVVLMALGHSPTGRFDKNNQIGCATLARMGAIVLTVDMFGVSESALETGPDAHRTPLALTMQTWDNMRALDMLLSLDGADPNRVGVSGASGGGTQTMLLTALDSRVKVSVPVVMTSSSFFGGCPCESGRPIHRSKEHFTNNAEIAAMAAPRPMLVVSDGKDWTKNVPEIEFPFLQKIYALAGTASNVENAHLPAEGHDYGPSKRRAMYQFMAKHLKLDISVAQDESKVTVENESAMHVFADGVALPAGTCRNMAEIEKSLKDMQKR
jgi:dienelactone hydrolase